MLERLEADRHVCLTLLGSKRVSTSILVEVLNRFPLYAFPCGQNRHEIDERIAIG